MFRFNLTLSVLVSIIFVSGPFWLKTHKQTQNAEQAIESVTKPSELAIYEGSPRDIYLGEKATSTKNLSQTDLLGRQLFSDYLDLSSRGQATPETIGKIAGSYADSILNLQTFTKIDRSSLTITKDTQASLNSYANAVVYLRISYGDKIEKLSKQGGTSNISDPKFIIFMNSVSDLYKQAAQDMQNIPVPQSLADNHVKLVNNYLSSAQAAKAIAGVESDPLGAYAALNSHAKNEEEENTLLANIQNTMIANGIIFPSSI